MSAKLGDMKIIKFKKIQDKHLEYVELLNKLGDMMVREEQETTFVEYIKNKGGLIWFDSHNLRGRKLTFNGPNNTVDVDGIKSFVCAVLETYHNTKGELLEKDAAGRTRESPQLRNTCVNVVYDDL